MVNRIMEIAEELSEERRKDSVLAVRMEAAVREQSPRFFMISPIERSSQDLQLFGMTIGETFRGTRVPKMSILPPNRSPMLFVGPAAFNADFSSKRGVILTFELTESDQVIRDSLDNLMRHPCIAGLPILVFRIDYDLGRARIVPHGKGRDYEAENKLLSRLRRPDDLDTETLVLICSDSRIRPPTTPRGLPMAIQTLGGFIPRYSGTNDESSQLASFFSDWLSAATRPKILIVGHGNFEGGGASCGAAQACLNPEEVKNPALRPVLLELQQAVLPFENRPSTNPEDRVKALMRAIKENLLTYAAIREAAVSHNGLIDLLLMDTISNALSLANI